jgi:hypothetical protein
MMPCASGGAGGYSGLTQDARGFVVGRGIGGGFHCVGDKRR